MKFSERLITYLSYIKQPKKRNLIKLAHTFKKQKGLEVGGPSLLFALRGYFPIYTQAQIIDGVNFSNDTVWEGRLAEGKNFNYFKSKKGYQYIAEATDLGKIPNEAYDFVLSCHSLEHVANPLKALLEWKRVLHKDGRLILVLPDKRYTFDSNRPYTTFDHLLNDYKSNVDEWDTTHFNESIELHNFEKDAIVQSKNELKERVQNNYTNRCVHHHVFNQQLVKEMLAYCGFSVQYQQEAPPFHLITIAVKSA